MFGGPVKKTADLESPLIREFLIHLAIKTGPNNYGASINSVGLKPVAMKQLTI